MTVNTPTPGKTQEQWLADVMPEVEQAQAMLEESMSKDPATLSAQADIYEDTYRRMVEVLAEADGWLDHAEYVELMQLDSSLTVQERGVILKVAVMPSRLLRDKIKGLCQSLHSRMRRSQWRA